MPNPNDPVPEQIGREGFLRHISRFKRQRVPPVKGLTQSAMLGQILRRAGISDDEFNRMTAESAAYTRAVGQAFIQSLPERQVDSAAVLSKYAHLSDEIDYPGKGTRLPLKGVIHHSWSTSAPQAAPVEPRSEYLPSDSIFQDCHVHGEGTGSGISWPWDSDDGTRGQSCAIQFAFQYRPTTTGVYLFRVAPLVYGHFRLVADDGVWDSKEAWCSVQSTLNLKQVLPWPVEVAPGVQATEINRWAPASVLFFEGGQNILRSDPFAEDAVLNLSSLLYSNILCNVSLMIYLDAYARGDGSIADLNSANPQGRVACGGVWVSLSIVG